MACAEVRKHFMNQVKASLAKHGMLFILGEPGCKHGHILGNLAETQLDCKVIQLPLWPDLDPVPTLLDFENRIVAYARHAKQTELQRNAREALRSIAPVLDLPGAFHFLTDEGVYITLYKARGWERLLGLLDAPERSTVVSELLQGFAKTVRELARLWPNSALTLAIDVKGTLDEAVNQLISNLASAGSLSVIVAAEEGGNMLQRPQRYPALRIPRLTKDESDTLLHKLGIDPSKCETVWSQAKGLPLLTFLMSAYLIDGDNTNLTLTRSQLPIEAFWYRLSNLEQKILAALTVLKADIDVGELSRLIEVPESECRAGLHHLTSAGLVDEMRVGPHLAPMYAVDICAAKSLDAILPSEMRVEVSSTAGTMSLSKVIEDPIANPLATVRCSSYLLTSGNISAHRDSVLRTAPVLLTWGASQKLRESLEHAAQTTDRPDFYLHYLQAILDLEDKDYQGAQHKLHRALTELEATHMGPVASIVAKHWLARTYDQLGYFDEALHIMEGVVGLIRRSPELSKEFPELLAASLSNMGLLLKKTGRLDDALKAFDEALTLDRVTGNLRGQAHNLRNSAFIMQDSNKLEEALQLHQSALELDREISNVVGQAIDYGNIGAVLLTLGRISESRGQLLKAKTLFERLNARAELRQIEELLATIESGAAKDGEDTSHTR